MTTEQGLPADWPDPQGEWMWQGDAAVRIDARSSPYTSVVPGVERAQASTTQSHDWAVQPVEWRYDGRPLAEFEDPMLVAAERVRIRFGGGMPRDVVLALNDAYRRGMQDTRNGLAAEFEQLSGQRNPALSDEDNARYSDVYANVADRIHNPERYSGCVANVQSMDGCDRRD